MVSKYRFALKHCILDDIWYKIRNPMSRNRNVGCGSYDDSNVKGEKLIYPAASRNKEPILQVLQSLLTSAQSLIGNPLFLEISSGSGQHVAHFAPHFPFITFQPSEYDESLLGSISYYARECPTKNILEPIIIDVTNNLSNYGFLNDSIDYIYNANMIHISPFECTIGLFKNAGTYLKSKGLLITYGPYSKDNVITPQSNIDFNQSLKSRNPSWGIRDISDLEKLAKENKLSLLRMLDMPANNKILVWIKE